MTTQTCQDCGRPYAGGPYYSTMTGTICPSCAGPYLDPDRPGDLRRPLMDGDAWEHASLSEIMYGIGVQGWDACTPWWRLKEKTRD